MSFLLAIPLVVVFTNAAWHKVGLALVYRTTDWHPIVISAPRLRPWAPAVFAAFAVADLLVIPLLIWFPLVGALLAASLLLAYTIVGVLTLRETGECHCFARWLQILDARTVRGLAWRNIALLTVCALVAFPLV